MFVVVVMDVVVFMLEMVVMFRGVSCFVVFHVQKFDFERCHSFFARAMSDSDVRQMASMVTGGGRVERARKTRNSK